MKNLTISRRYAKALLLIGKEDGNAESYREELSGVTGVFLDHPELNDAVTNPMHNSDTRRKVLEEVLNRLDLSELMKRFLLLLFDKNRFSFLETINEYYQKMADELKGIATASLSSATELSDETIVKIRDSLSQMTGKNIRLEVTQDPSLIGGIVTKIGDLVLDGSIKTQLINMRETLKRGESLHGIKS